MYPAATISGNPNGYVESHFNSHRVYIEVLILNINNNLISDASSRLISGHVDVDANANVSRSGKVQLWDPFNDLGLGLGGSSQFDRIIKINYWVQNMTGGQQWRTAVATCIVTQINRDGSIVNLEFKGKEVLADHGLHTPHTWPAGWPKGTVITNGMTIFTGETMFWDYSAGAAWNMLGASGWSIDSGDNLWAKFRELATSMGCRLFYNGEGILVIRPLQVAPIFTMDQPWMTSEPSMDYDFDNLINMVRVEGAMLPTWDGGEAQLVYEALPDPNHPFSCWSLARNGYPRIIPKIISDSSINDFALAADIAWNELSIALLQTNNVTLTGKVMPWFEENDVLTIMHPKLYTNTFLTKWTIPLVGDGEMSMNFMSNTSFAYTGGLEGGGSAIHNAHIFGTRPAAPRIKPHGPSGAFGSAHLPGGRNIDKLRGENWYGGKGSSKGGGKKGSKKGNKDKGKGRGRK